MVFLWKVKFCVGAVSTKMARACRNKLEGIPNLTPCELWVVVLYWELRRILQAELWLAMPATAYFEKFVARRARFGVKNPDVAVGPTVRIGF